MEHEKRTTLQYINFLSIGLVPSFDSIIIMIIVLFCELHTIVPEDLAWLSSHRRWLAWNGICAGP